MRGVERTFVMMSIVYFIGSFIVSINSEDLDPDSKEWVNYLSTAELSDGEVEVRMRFGDIIVKETSFKSEDKDSGQALSLVLRQMSSGPHFLQMVFKVNEKRKVIRKRRKLVECEVVNDWNSADEFRRKFEEDLTQLGLSLKVPPIGVRDYEIDNRTTEESQRVDSAPSLNLMQFDLKKADSYKNVSARYLENDEVIGELQQSFDLILNQRLCKRLHRKEEKLKKLKKKEENEEINSGSISNTRVNNLFNWNFGRVPGTMWCGVGTIADKFSSLGAYLGADRCCRTHDSCPYQIPGFTTRYGLFNYRVHTTMSHCSCDDRLDFGSVMRVPGTFWCGRGYSATEKKDLGGFTGADKCCRYHDISCPYFIEAFELKYGLYNWRLFTLNHCSCDDRFRSCLKMTNTGAANFVGKLFFNVVQTKCFVLKPEKVCTKSSWWGKCLKHEYKKQAYLRDPLPY